MYPNYKSENSKELRKALILINGQFISSRQSDRTFYSFRFKETRSDERICSFHLRMSHTNATLGHKNN